MIGLAPSAEGLEVLVGLKAIANMMTGMENWIPKGSRRQRQYDVPREDNHLKVCNYICFLPFLF